ncbi:MAG TPA: amidohydrolase [Flavobacteriaceae bacterium]|jgi:imidazolonepropionase-like amidohydrolase|nr:amidohydrolase [Flavobacteriaceae bacterium]HBS12537.1 amidohydrolase [Flavobacteriaceae bacterium]
MKKILFAFAIFFTSILFAQSTYIHCGKLIDTNNGKVLKEMTVVVSGSKITAVKKGFIQATSDQDKTINLKNKTVLPGLIDMHVHIEGEYDAHSYTNRFRLADADVAFKSTVFAKRTLLAGFTTVRDLGGSGVNISLRNAINKGTVIGPRIYTAGKAIATTGGHADPTNGVRKELRGNPGPKEGVINSPADARKAVRQRYKNGADVIKITATGGVLSVAKDGSGPQFTMEELKAIIKTANDYGMITAAHAHGAEGMKRAVLAGITTIEHGTLMTDEIMGLMKEKDTYYVPTITAGKYVAEKAAIKGFYPALVVPKALAIGPKIQKTFGEAYKKGVPIAFGTDAGVFPHGENGKEFGYMVEAGMPPMKAILSATSVNAKVLKNNAIGSIEEGKLADIIATDDDPTKNIHTLEKVSFVMKGGVVYKD